MPDDRHAHVRVVLRPIATPVALGLAAILLGTTMLSCLQLEWLSGAAEQRTVGWVGLAAAFPLELLAAVLAFLARDALAGTGLATFSSVWSVSGITLLTGPSGATNDALGVFLLLGAFVLLLLLVSAGPSRLVFGLLIATGCARLAVTGLYEVFASDGLRVAAGVVGFALTAVCAYGIVALLMEDLPRKGLLPTGRSGAGAASLAGGFDEQLGQLENEAGVRRQL
jgi:succinate-acetate transporter protein